MSWLHFHAFPLWLNLTVFAAAAVIVWVAGTVLAGATDAIARRTGMGHALAGAVLLASATSLPEIAVTLTASIGGSPVLAGNNLLGGLTMQLAILAIADVTFGRGPLTYFTPRPVLLLQGVLLILLLTAATAAIAAGELVSFAGVGLWSLLLLGIYLLSLVVIRRYEGQAAWAATEGLDEVRRWREQVRQRVAGEETTSRTWLWGRFALSALAVLVGGYLVARTAEALAVQTGLGIGFVGATLVAICTSLPELSTTIKAVRLGAYAMAVSDILGTNGISVALLFVADVGYRDGPILDALGSQAVFLASLGSVVTCIFLWGMLERRDRTVLRMGVDSATVLAVYAAGLVVLYFIR